MMNKLILLLLFSFFLMSNCQKKESEPQTNNYSKEKKLNVDSLKITFKELQDNQLNKNKNEKYLTLFPSNYNQFKQTFGYDDATEKGAPLYDDSFSYIKLFFQLLSKNPSFLQKAFDIANGAKWEADAENFFQKELKSFIISDPKQICPILQKYDVEQEKQIWNFIFEGSDAHENENLAQLLLNNCNVLKNKQILEKEVSKNNSTSNIPTPEELKKNMLSNGYSLLTEKSCDLNQDDKQDYILAFELKNTDEIKDDFIYESPVYVFIKEGKKYRIYKNSNIILTSNKVCPSNGFQNITVKNNFFTIEEDECSGYYFTNNYTTFKYNKTKNSIDLFKIGKILSDRTNSDKNVPDIIKTVKDFGKITFEDFYAPTINERIKK